jgi:hypothetical protein
MGLELPSDLSAAPSGPVDMTEMLYEIEFRLEDQRLIEVKRQRVNGKFTGLKRVTILDPRLQQWAVASLCKGGHYSPERVEQRLTEVANPWNWLMTRLPEAAIALLYFRLIEREEQG